MEERNSLGFRKSIGMDMIIWDTVFYGHCLPANRDNGVSRSLQLIVVLITELHDAFEGYDKLLLRNRKYNAEIVWVLETFSRKAENGLLGNKGLHKLEFGRKFWKSLHFNPNHQIHGAPGLNWMKPSTELKSFKCKISIFLKKKRIRKI